MLLPLLCAVFVALADRATGTAAVGVVLGAGQFALHQLMELLHPAHSVGPALRGTPSMLVMHAVATAVTAGPMRVGAARRGAASSPAARCP